MRGRSLTGIQEVSASASELNSMAVRLQQVLAQFKLEEETYQVARGGFAKTTLRQAA